MITVDAGLIDAGYCGIVEMLIINHSEAVFTVCVGDRVAQVVLLSELMLIFKKLKRKI